MAAVKSLRLHPRRGISVHILTVLMRPHHATAACQQNLTVAVRRDACPTLCEGT